MNNETVAKLEKEIDNLNEKIDSLGDFVEATKSVFAYMPIPGTDKEDTAYIEGFKDATMSICTIMHNLFGSRD